jgi:lysozyme
VARTALQEGIDVSHFNDVDWPNLDPTIQFAILKATDGSSSPDPNYVLNMTVARQTSLKLGSYHFFRPDDDPSAQFQNIITVADLRPDDFPIAIDVENAEDTGRRLTPADVPVLAALASSLNSHYGTLPMIYTNASSWSDLGQPATSGSVNFGLCPLWIADPNNDPPQYPQPWILWTIWQYEVSAVSGVKQPIDRDRFAGSRDGLLRLRNPLLQKQSYSPRGPRRSDR